MDGVHYIQQHVVTNHKFSLCIREMGYNKAGGPNKEIKYSSRNSNKNRFRDLRGILTDLEIAWMTLEKPTASFSSSCLGETKLIFSTQSQTNQFPSFFYVKMKDKFMFMNISHRVPAFMLK